MNRLVVSSFLLLMAWALSAQKADFRAAEKFRTENMSPKTGDMSVRPTWIDETNRFWYSYKVSSGKNYYYVNADSKTKELMFDRRYMASEIHKLLHKPFNELDLPLTSLEFEKKSTTRFTFKIDTVRFLYDMSNRKLVIKDTVPKDKNKNRWASKSPDSTLIVFAKDYNLYIMKANDPDSTEIQLSFDGELNYSYSMDQSDTTSGKRSRASARWFKNSKKLYVVRSDVRKVGDLFVINALAQPRPKLETYKYAMPGEENVPQEELKIFDVESRKKVDVDLKKWRDQTISVLWTSQESADKMIISRKKRDLKEVEICMVNANSGEVKALFSEQTFPYFNNEYGQLSVLNEGKDIIWWSERTGWGQLYLYDGNGNLKREITNDYFVTGRVSRIDTLGRELYIEGFGKEPGVHPYYTMIYRVSLDKPGITLLTPEDASHSFNMSKTNKYFVDTYSRVDMIPQSVLRDKNGNVVLKLEEADLSQVYTTGWKMPEVIVVKAKDGVTDLYGVLYKPFDFDSTRKYPIISYVYPGPQTESVPYTFSVNGRTNTALAQLGFVVVNFGHRGGSPQRNHYYHTYGYDNLRDYPLADDRYGIEQLADRYSFIDVTKVGIYGHSGGGFMSTAAILGHPDFYDVAVSSAGNHDNNIYNQWWGETHHGVKEVEKKTSGKKDKVVDADSIKVIKDILLDADSVKVKKEDVENDMKEDKIKKDEKTNFMAKIPYNQDLAANLKGHLLLVFGDIDNNVHPGNSIRVADALIKANKRFDLMMMPGQRHSFGTYSTYFERMMWHYFAEHLLGDYRTNVDITDL